jgi:hypothetical protein
MNLNFEKFKVQVCKICFQYKLKMSGLFAVDELLNTDTINVIYDNMLLGLDFTNTKCPSGEPCTVCPSGKYKPSRDIGDCTSCIAGKYGTSTSATDETTCVSCGPGKYTVTTGVSSCLSCATGTYKGSCGPGNCTMCPVNTASLIIGSVSVSDCVCALGFQWNSSYPLRRLLQEDVTYNCPSEEHILVIDPVTHYIYKPPPSPPPPPPSPSMWNWNLSPLIDMYDLDNHTLTHRLLQMERKLLSEVCIRCESHFYKDTISNSR